MPKFKNGVITKNKRKKQKNKTIEESLKIVHITPLAGNLEGLFKNKENENIRTINTDV